MTYKYHSTKTYHQAFPVAYRQYKADSHCNQIHGYALTIHLEFGCNDLDARNWCVDFGSLRPLKDLLEEWFDHTLLVATDDPQREALLNLGKLGIAKVTEVERTGCEGIADFIYEYVNEQFLPLYGYGDRVWCTRVEVRETDSNMAYRSGDRVLDPEKFMVNAIKETLSKMPPAPVSNYPFAGFMDSTDSNEDVGC